MGRIFEGVKEFLKEHFEAASLEPQDEGMLAFRLEDEDGREWGCLAISDDDAEQFMFYSVMLDNAPDERLDEVMRFVTMANYGMQLGNFELDLDDGEVRFKTSVDLEDVGLSTTILRNVVELNLTMMGLYYDGLKAVIDGETSAAEAIEEIEVDDDEDDDED